MTDDRKTYRISGRITGRAMQLGVEASRIEARDKERIYDDLVGSAVTDQQGSFRIEFDESYFRERFGDRRP